MHVAYRMLHRNFFGCRIQYRMLCRIQKWQRPVQKHTISCILYDVIYDIVCLVYDIIHLTYDVVYDIVCAVVYKNGKDLYHAHMISYILYDVVYDIVCL